MGVERVTSHLHLKLTHKENTRSKLTYFGDQTISSHPTPFKKVTPL